MKELNSDRWNSPYDHTMVYGLFKRNFTELNDAYWAHCPASNTIQRKAKAEIKAKNLQPLDYFDVHDEEDRHVADSYEKWDLNYREYLNYTRLSFLMLLNSCFETYLRTIVSYAIESKPGILIQCKDAVDGVSLLITRSEYANPRNKRYQFGETIDSVVKGNWYERNNNYKRWFLNSPLTGDEIKELDQLRTLRNKIGHYFARNDTFYTVPLFPDYQPAERLSHKRLIRFFRLVNEVVTKIDNHLQSEYIGSYDIIRFYLDCANKGMIKGLNTEEKARSFQTIIGTSGLKPVSKEFCANLIQSCGLEEFKSNRK